MPPRPRIIHRVLTWTAVIGLALGTRFHLRGQRLDGIDFGPFLNGANPDLGASVSNTTLQTLLTVVQPHFDWIRTYNTNANLASISPLAHARNLKVAVGAALGSDSVANDGEIATVIQMAQAGQADMIIVGSETLLRGDLSAANLTTYIRQVKEAVKDLVPPVWVTTADAVDQWSKNPTLKDEVDVVMINSYPYWRGVPLDRAMASLNQGYQQIKQLANGKPVWFSETGIPSAGDSVGLAVPSEANAAAYFQNFISWANDQQVPYFYFSAFDESYKSTGKEGPQGGHFGLWYSNLTLKPGMQAVFDGAGTADNWTVTQPMMELIQLPAYGNTSLSIKGLYLGLTPSDYNVLIYLRVNNGHWYAKPIKEDPLTPLGPEGVWETDVTTGVSPNGEDEMATEYRIFLVPAAYQPSEVYDVTNLPAELNAFPCLVVTRNAQAGLAPDATAPMPSNPLNQAVAEGMAATFSVSDRGPNVPVTYQWYKNGTALPGETDATLTLSNVHADDAGNYYALATNAYGTTTSGNATLVVGAYAAAAITLQPSNQIVTAGGMASLSANATAAPAPALQWERQAAGANAFIPLSGAGPFSGVRSGNLIISNVTMAMSGDAFRLVATNDLGQNISSSATLTVNPALAAPGIAQDPASQTIVVAGHTTFSASATGNPMPSYQWQTFFSGNGTWGNLTEDSIYAGTATANLTISHTTLLMNGTVFRLVAFNSQGTANSGNATLTVTPMALPPPPSFVNAPLEQTVLLGKSVSFSVTISGTAPFSYQWLKNGKPIKGATKATFSISKVTLSDAGNYSVLVTNPGGHITSDSVPLTVIAAVKITVQPKAVTAKHGATVGFMVRATGTSPLKYQWSRNHLNLADSGQIQGSATSTLRLSHVTTASAGAYRVVVSNPAGAVASESAKLTIK